MRNAWRTPSARVGTVLVAVMLVAALFGVLATPYDPIDIDAAARLTPPGHAHWLGTDEWGRDVLSRVLRGAATSVSISSATALTATALGGIVGSVAGYFGGWIDRATVGLLDALLAFPSLILALGMASVLGAGSGGVLLALSIAYLPSVARVVRATVLGLSTRAFVEASILTGNSRLYTLARHVLPNAAGPVIVLATALFGWALLAESALSFLGLGVPPPAASWGGMLSDSRPYFEEAPWLALAPGLAISLSLLGINLVGDALRDAFDPRTM